MLVASLGTPYEIRTAGTILFIEDIAAKPYQIDRMLMQLKLAGKLADVRGIVFGEMLDCVSRHKDQGYTLEEVVMRVVGDLGVPVAYGLRSGHVSRQQHHFADRRAGGAGRQRQRSEPEDSGSSNDGGGFIAVAG